MHSLRDQVRIARLARGWTVQQLLDASGLACDRSSLDRKLRGLQVLRTEEYEAMMIALSRDQAKRRERVRRVATARQRGGRKRARKVSA